MDKKTSAPTDDDGAKSEESEPEEPESTKLVGESWRDEALENNWFFEGEKYPAAKMVMKLKHEKFAESITAEANKCNPDAPLPERPLFYWVRKSATCDHETREKLVMELDKLQRQRVLERNQRKAYIHQDYTFSTAKPFLKEDGKH